MDKYKFGEFIYQRRKQLHMTQDELGRCCDVTNKAVSKWETGETMPDLQTLKKLALALQISTDELLKQEINPPVEPVTVEVEKVIERQVLVNKKTGYIWGIISTAVAGILLFLVVILSLLFFAEDNKPEEINLSIDDYCIVTPCSTVKSTGQSLEIRTDVEVYEGVNELSFDISYVIHYYYLNIDGVECQLTYDRDNIHYNLGEEIILQLSPKFVISNFQSYVGFDISYEISNFSGSMEVLE